MLNFLTFLLAIAIPAMYTPGNSRNHIKPFTVFSSYHDTDRYTFI